MAKYGYGVEVICPYYKDEAQQRIRCEGVGPGTVIHLTFKTKREQIEYRKQHCEGCWRKCMIADALNRKYDYQ